jgi:hypothetical protein
MGYYDPGLLNPGLEYWYQLRSCNIINCSVHAVETNATVLGKIYITLLSRCWDQYRRVIRAFAHTHGLKKESFLRYYILSHIFLDINVITLM